jgi:Enoyl-CoA hydratase/carnithine racemase
MIQMEYETLKYEEKDATGILTLNRPKRLNAINEKMVDELEGFWMKRMYDLHTRVIILIGAGEKVFVVGWI